MAAALSDKILFQNAMTNPSFETASGTTTVSTNMLQNPGFETAGATTNIWTNLVTNPSFEASDGQVALWRNLATNPTFEAVNTGTTVQRTNLCINPNFDVALTGWSGQLLKAGYGRSSVRSLSGTHSAWGVAVDTQGDSMLVTTPNYVVQPNTYYTVSAYVYVPAGVVATDFRGGNRNLWAVGWTGTGATAIGTANIDFSKTNQWQRLSTTLSTGSTATALNVRLYFPANDLGVYWDNVLVEQTDQLRPYFDGSTTDARGWDYAWTGTATASTSTAAAATVEINRNHAPNPRMYGTSGTTILRRNYAPNPRAVASLASYGTSTIAPTAISSHPAGITTANRVTYAANANNPGVLFGYTPVSGTQYTISAWVYHETVPTSSGGQALAQTGVTSMSGPPAIVAKQWQRFSWVYTASGTAEFGFRIASPTSAGSFLITGIQIEALPRVEEYFDGTTPAYQRTNFATDPGATSLSVGASKLGWRNTRWWGGGAGAGTYSLVTGASDGPVPGLTTYARKTWTASGTTNGDTGFDHGITGASGMPCEGNTQYTFSSYLRATGVGKTGGNIQIIWYDSTGTQISSSTTSSVALPSGTWVRLTNTATSPANASYMIAVSDCDSGTLWAPGETLDGTGLLVEKSSTLGSYFDGRASTVPELTHTWAGVVNDSYSFTYNSDYTYAWTGTVDGSESNLRGSTPIDYMRSGGDSSNPVIVSEGNTKILRYQYRSEGTAIAINSTATSGNAAMLDKVFTVVAKVRTSINLSGLRLRLGGANGPSFDTVAGEWKTVSFTGTHPNTGYTSVWGPSLAAGQYGAILDIAEFSVYEGTYKGSYFNGTTPSFGDFAYAWTGTPDNSPSVKRATKVLNTLASRNTGVADTQFHVYSSIENGERMVRYLTPAGSASSGWRIASSSGLEYGNIIAGEQYTLYLKYRQTGWTNPTITFTLRDAPSTNPLMADAVITNVPSGSWQTLTRTFTATANGLNTSLLYISLPVSVSADTDAVFDVAEWYLVPGTYTGPVFDGASPAALDLTYSWVGTPDSSASLAYAPSVAGVSGGNVRHHQSTEWGRRGKSIKIIPIDVGGSNATSIVVPVTLTPGKTYTVLGTRYLDKPLTGTLNSTYAGKISLLQTGVAHISPSTALPNVAGEATQRWTFTVDPTATTMSLRLGHGGNASSGNVWWDDILVVEGTYTGPYFDGSRPGKENLAKTAAQPYNGTVHATGVSFAGSTWTRTTAGINQTTHLTRQYVDKNELILGETYTVSVTVANDQSTTQSILLDWCDAGSTSFNIQPGEIRRIVVTASRPATGQWVYGDVYRFSDIHVISSATETRSILFKDWTIEQGTTSSDYFTGTGDYTYAWSGAANASTSVQNGVAAKEWGNLTNGVGTLTSTVPSKFGTKCIEVTTKGVNGDGIYGNGVDVTPNTAYRTSAWVKLTETVPNFSGLLRFKDSASNILLDVVGNVTSLLRVGEWVNVTVTGTSPATATTVQPLWRVYTTHTPTKFYVDGTMVTESALDIDYFDGATPAYQNLLANPSFGTNTTTWGPNTPNYSLVRDDTVGRTALGSGKVTVSVKSTGDINTFSSRTPAKPGEVFTVSAWVKTAVSATMYLKLDWRNPGGNTISQSTSTATVGTDWTRMTLTATAPAGADSVFVRVGSDVLQEIGFIYWVDDVLLERSAVLHEYFAGTGDFSYSWVGAANDSKSVKTAPAAAAMSGNLSGRIAWQSNDGPVPGKKSIAVLSGTPNADTFSQFSGTLPFGGENLGGRTFTILATRKTVNDLPATGNDSRAWKLSWVVTKADGSVVQVLTPIGPTTAGVHKVKHTFTFDADTNTTTSFMRLYNGSATPNTTVWWDDVAIIEGAYPGEYFDGSTANTPDFTYAWAGTANASKSTVRVWNVAGSHTSMRALIYSSASAPFSGASSAKGIVSEVGYQPRYEVLYAVKPNRIYTALAKMRASTGPVNLSMKWITNPDIHAPIISESASNNQWTTVRGSSISPAGATHLALWIGVPSNTALGTVFDIDQLMLVEGEYNGPFGTGDSYGWEWEGTPHASTSKGYPVRLAQLAGKPLFFQTAPGTYVLTDIDPAKNPVLAANAPRTIYSVVNNLMDVPTGQLPAVFLYGGDALSDTIPNSTIILRQQSMTGEVNTLLARRTGGGGPLTMNVPATGKQILISGTNENGYLFSAVNKSALTVDAFAMEVPHERINIYGNSAYHQHIATYIYPGVHSSAVRQEMVKLLAHEYAIPGM
jgi:hypothetical protein